MDVSTSEANKYIERLSLPKRSCETLSYCTSKPEDLKLYLENLPHSNAAELCNRLYKLLPEVAGLKTPPGRKMALLDLVMPEAMACVQRLTNNLALTPSSTKILSLAIAMQKYLAEGYKSIVVSILQSPAAPQEILSSACRSAINVLHQILMDCWECYIPLPANVWREIHAIYSIAKSRGLANNPSFLDGARTGGVNSPHTAYVVPLMISCVDPARYTPQDIRAIEAFLQQQAHLVELSDSSKEGLFVVDPDTDRGPQYSFKVDEVTPEQFKIVSYRLVRFIEEKIATGSLSGLSERLAKELCKYWSSEIQRKDDPHTDDTPLKIVIGLSHIHRKLTNTPNMESYIKKTRRGARAEMNVLELLDDNAGGIRDTFIQKRGNIHSAGTGRGMRTQDLQETAEQAIHISREYDAVRTNTSAGGARIEFNAPTETLTAGEIILIQQPGSEPAQIGLVRWTQVTRQLNRRLGVEILGDTALPCAVSQTTAASKGSEQFYPGLIVSRNGENQIVLPTLAFKPYSSVNLYSTSSKSVANLQGCIDSTFHISIFKIESMPQI